jgi:hypothetical protein
VSARFGLLDQQFFEQARHGVVDELAAVVGMEAANHEGKLFQYLFQNRNQPALRDLRCGGHDLPLRHFVDGIDVIQAFVAILVAWMHSVDAEIAGTAFRPWLAPSPMGMGVGRVG